MSFCRTSEVLWNSLRGFSVVLVLKLVKKQPISSYQGVPKVLDAWCHQAHALCSQPEKLWFRSWACALLSQQGCLSLLSFPGCLRRVLGLGEFGKGGGCICTHYCLCTHGTRHLMLNEWYATGSHAPWPCSLLLSLGKLSLWPPSWGWRHAANWSQYVGVRNYWRLTATQLSLESSFMGMASRCFPLLN